MRRTLARAAPVAIAFDCNLAAFGFPFDEGRRREGKSPDAPDLRTPLEVAQFVADSTTIGEGGEYFQELAQSGRFLIHGYPRNGVGFPPQLGRVVATTPSPDPARRIAPLDVAQELASRRSQLLLFGLGPRGLPREVLEGARFHLEMTGRNISFETATALGALPALVHAHLHHLAGAHAPPAPARAPHPKPKAPEGMA